MVPSLILPFLWNSLFSVIFFFIYGLYFVCPITAPKRTKNKPRSNIITIMSHNFASKVWGKCWLFGMMFLSSLPFHSSNFVPFDVISWSLHVLLTTEYTSGRLFALSLIAAETKIYSTDGFGSPGGQHHASRLSIYSNSPSNINTSPVNPPSECVENNCYVEGFFR